MERLAWVLVLSEDTRAGLSPDEMAELLRDADFTLEQTAVALLAFVPSEVRSVERDHERIAEVRKRIRLALYHLPPEPPLTPEQEAECMATIGEALRKRGW